MEFSKNGAFIIDINKDISAETFQKIRKYAEESEPYLPYNYEGIPHEERINRIMQGKIGEEAFSIFLKSSFNLDYKPDYPIYKLMGGVVEDFDFKIDDKKIDIKISQLKEGSDFEKCQLHFNFIIPETQEIKDILVYGLMNAEKTKIAFTACIDKENFLLNRKERVVDGTKCYFLPFSYGDSMACFASISKDLEYFREYSDYFDPTLLPIKLPDGTIFNKLYLCQSGTQEEVDNMIKVYEKMAISDPARLYNPPEHLHRCEIDEKNYKECTVENRIKHSQSDGKIASSKYSLYSCCHQPNSPHLQQHKDDDAR